MCKTMNLLKDQKQENGSKKEFELGQEPQIGLFTALTTYFGYFLMALCGHIRDFFASITGFSRYKTNARKNYATLFKSWESFFTRRMFHRVQDCWNRPLCSGPGAYVNVMDRETRDNNCTLFTTGKHTRCLNLGSYNYLGMADDWKSVCGKEVMDSVSEWPISMSSSRMDMGTLSLHDQLEKTVAKFVGKEAAYVFSMGYGTNLTAIPSLMGEESLIISDALNHTSIVNGARSSDAKIRVFRHNDTADLDEVLREAIVKGQPRHHRPWKKIIVMVEGIYSMEGNICNLPEIVRICKKYKAYLYVDEAHSIGALGKTGRGVCEYHNVDTADVDILMGTFTKSFSGMGGYVAGSHELVRYLRARATAGLHHNSMSPIVCKQVLTALKVITGEDGTSIGVDKISQLRENSNYFRQRMKELGLHVYGHENSPIIPVLIYNPGKVAAFSRECLKRGLAVVVVGFPATSVILSRARFCIAASLTKNDIDFAVKVIEEVASLILIRYEHSFIG